MSDTATSSVSSSVVCNGCGGPITGLRDPGDLTTRPPCDVCGSTGHSDCVLAVALNGHGVLGQAEFIGYPQVMLGQAEELIAEGRFSLAVVVCHMACEFAAERAISHVINGKTDDPDEQERIRSLFNGNNLGNERNRDAYVELVGYRIQDQPFWARFKNSADRRNKIMHAAGWAGKEEAEASLRATSELVLYLKPIAEA